jgi:hypothetical protein
VEVRVAMSAVPDGAPWSFPTATQADAVAQETLRSFAGTGPGPKEVTGVHEDPDIVSTRPVPPAAPTATQNATPVHDTASRLADEPTAVPMGRVSGV